MPWFCAAAVPFPRSDLLGGAWRAAREVCFFRRSVSFGQASMEFPEMAISVKDRCQAL